MFIPDRDFCHPDLGSQIQQQQHKIINLGLPFFCMQKFYKTENFQIFWTGSEKELNQLKKISSLFKIKIFTKLSENMSWIWDRRSGIRIKLVPDTDPGVKKSTGFRILKTAYHTYICCNWQLYTMTSCFSLRRWSLLPAMLWATWRWATFRYCLFFILN
jgi:hypothetical protein